MIQYLRAANVKDGRLDLEDVKLMDFSPSEQTFYQLRPGDVLVSEGAGSLDAVGASAVWSGEIAGIVCFQNTLLRLRPRPGNDPRFLMWWARHAYGSGLFASIAGGANIYHLGAQRVRLLPMATPGHREQRAIADYLDAETARFDATLETLSRANEILGDWLDTMMDKVIWEHQRELIPLMHLTPADRQIQYGIVLPGPDVPDGPAIVKGGDLMTGSLRADQLCRTTHEIERHYARSRLRHNDVVFAIRGAVGATALVPREAEGANITQDVARVSPRHDVDPLYLLFALRSRTLQQQAKARVVGATITGLNIRDLKRVRVPCPSVLEQRRIGLQLAEAQQHRDAVVRRRTRQIELLLERRQALITAAVTGELEIPGVAA
jgi:type I restriction enzyme S subunit